MCNRSDTGEFNNVNNRPKFVNMTPSFTKPKVKPTSLSFDADSCKMLKSFQIEFIANSTFMLIKLVFRTFSKFPRFKFFSNLISNLPAFKTHFVNEALFSTSMFFSFFLLP